MPKVAEPQQLEEFAPAAQSVVMMPRGRIVPRALQPRTEHEVEKQKTLGQNIKYLRDKGEGIEGSGVLQPLQVTWEPGAIADEDGRIKPNAKVLINIGETRYYATGYAGFTDSDLLPVNISNSSDKQAYENGLIENVLRDDMKPEEAAVAVRAWMNSYDPPLSLQKAADKLGKKKAWVQSALSPLGIDDDVAVLLDGDPKRKAVAARINSVKDEDFRRELIESVQAGAKTPAILARIKRHNLQKRTPESDNGRYGTEPTPGIPIAPRIDVAAALDTAIRQAEAGLDALRGTDGRASAALKRNVRERARRLGELSRQFDEELDRERRKKWAKATARYKAKTKA